MYLYNGIVYTLDDDNPAASAIAIEGGRVLTSGEDNQILSEFSSRMEGFDLRGGIVVPGMTDAHIHLEHYALNFEKVDCETPTRQECLQRVADRAREVPPGTWVLGHGWNQNGWPEGFGDASELDGVTTQHPVYLTAKSLHAGWANSTALRLAGIRAETANPPNGRIGRDGGGNPDGLLFESAMELVARAIPEPTPEKIVRAIRAVLPTLWGMGLTGLHDYDRRRCFQALQILHERGELKLRVVKNLPVEDLGYAVGLGLRSGFGDDFLRIGGVKIFSDGALGPHTAAMLEPYLDDPDNRGLLFVDAEELFERGREAVEAGLSLTVHAIGDRANHEVLNAFTQLRTYERGLPETHKVENSVARRHRIEHVQVLHPEDLGRLGELEIIASMQPIHATSDMEMVDRYWGDRGEYAYAFRSVLESGVRLAFGSDAPVEPANPFYGLHAAVTRRRGDGSPGLQGWRPEQRLDLPTALRAYTQGPAYAAGMEDRLGRLAPGFLADLLVLDVDPFTCDPEKLRAAVPRATMVGGEWVHGGVE